LGSGAQDGVRNHLWGAFQTATQEWFNQKVEGVLGLGMPVWKVLNQGGIKTAEVGKMAWEGIKSAIPPALIQILIEKVISMIVPAAGAVLAIIEGLQAAWGTVSRVIQAFDRFMGFLKAVKTGQSGPQFGSALAAAGVVLIDFVSNWLLKRVRGAASKVAGKIKEIAKKIGNKVKGKLGKFKDKFFGNKGKKGQKDAKHSDEKKSKDKDNKEKDDIAKKQEKVNKAVEVAAAAVNKFSGKPVGKMLLTPILYSIKLGYGLKVLKPIKDGEHWAVHGELNPTSTKKTGALINEDGIPAHPSVRLGEPSPADIRKIRKEYNFKRQKRNEKGNLTGDSDSEAMAIWHYRQQRSTSQVHRGENNIKKFFGIPNEEGVKMVDLLKTDRKGFHVPVEVKNQNEMHLVGKGNAALAKFEQIANSLDDKAMQKLSHFEVMGHKDSKLPANFKIGDNKGTLWSMKSGTNPPEWEKVLVGGKEVRIKWGNLGDIST
jgi:hypothetical protein